MVSKTDRRSKETSTRVEGGSVLPEAPLSTSAYVNAIDLLVVCVREAPLWLACMSLQSFPFAVASVGKSIGTSSQAYP